MVVFDKKQIKILKGNLTTISESLDCSLQYVIKVVKNRAPQESELSKNIIAKCQSILNVFENETNQ